MSHYALFTFFLVELYDVDSKNIRQWSTRQILHFTMNRRVTGGYLSEVLRASNMKNLIFIFCAFFWSNLRLLNFKKNIEGSNFNGSHLKTHH